MRVLIVEDERKVLRNLVRGLQGEGYEVVGVATGEQGLEQGTGGAFDCVVLDLMLPGLAGLEVLAGLRGAGRKTPILVLSARDSVADRVLGLDSGADDYLVKPFAFAELLARLRVLLRRGGDPATSLRADDLELDLIQRRVTRAGAEIALTHREFDLLAYLLRHKDSVVTRDMLGHDVWKEPAHALTNVIDVFMTLLRRKIERPGWRPLIHTLRGIGYSLREPPCA